MKTKILNYTFSKTAKTITFTDYTTIRLDSVLIITNVMSNIIIYNFADPTKGGTVLNNVLTLDYDTSLMNDSDKLLIYYDDVVDGRTIFSGTVNSRSIGNAIDTTEYGSMVTQFSGSWGGTFYFETSNDQIYWDAVFILSRDEVSLQDNIDCNGTYSIKRSGRYIRYNCQNIIGTATITVVGRIGEGLSGADLVSLAMDRTNNTPLQVQLPKDFKQDTGGALIDSDAAVAYTFMSQNASSPMVIDTQGYKSIVVQQITSGVITPTISNDNLNFVGTVGYLSSAPTISLAATAGAGIHVFPVTARYFKLTGPASNVIAIVYLRISDFIATTTNVNQQTNIVQFGSQPVVTAGLNGVQAVGGNVATGIAPTTNPLQIGGVDDLKVPLTRRFLTDYLGRLQIGTNTGNPQGTGQSKALHELGFLNDYKNILEVRDTSKDENGFSVVELLNQILLEMKIINQQLYELPGQIDRGEAAQTAPEQYRNDITLFQ